MPHRKGGAPTARRVSLPTVGCNAPRTLSQSPEAAGHRALAGGTPADCSWVYAGGHRSKRVSGSWETSNATRHRGAQDCGLWLEFLTVRASCCCCCKASRSAARLQ